MIRKKLRVRRCKDEMTETGTRIKDNEQGFKNTKMGRGYKEE